MTYGTAARCIQNVVVFGEFLWEFPKNMCGRWLLGLRVSEEQPRDCHLEYRKAGTKKYMNPLPNYEKIWDMIL